MSDRCPICGFPATVTTPAAGVAIVDCARCGSFKLLADAVDLPKEWVRRTPSGRFAASHAIRRMQTGETSRPEINSDQLKSLWAQPLPNPGRQADLLVLTLGDASLPIGEYVYRRAERFCAEIGTQDDPTQGKYPSFNTIRKHLTDKGWVESDSHPPSPNLGLRLTFEGWGAYERLRRDVIESKTAFMAMSFSNATLGKLVAEHFVPAVRETGFELYRLDDRPKPGLIDNQMRVEIRAARFLVCDLTDENRGAYWEAGFAEGASKPVFYTCEKTKFSAARTHFDTEHQFTIRWEAANPNVAAEELKAAIRNAFPAEAIPPVRSNK